MNQVNLRALYYQYCNRMSSSAGIAECEKLFAQNKELPGLYETLIKINTSTKDKIEQPNIAANAAKIILKIHTIEQSLKPPSAELQGDEEDPAERKDDEDEFVMVEKPRKKSLSEPDLRSKNLENNLKFKEHHFGGKTK